MRLFIALPLPGALREALLRAQENLRRQGVRANYSREENLHLTLAFLGEVEVEAAAEAQEAVLSVDAPAFALTLAGSGAFGDLLWAGIQKNEALDRLAARVRGALEERGLSYDRKPFRPHITLARRVRSPEPPRVTLPRLSAQAEWLTLFRSERVEGTLVYTPLAEKRLR